MFFFETNLILRFWHQVIFQKDFSSSIVTPTTLNYQVRDGLACDRNSKDTKLKKKNHKLHHLFTLPLRAHLYPLYSFYPLYPLYPKGANGAWHRLLTLKSVKVLGANGVPVSECKKVILLLIVIRRITIKKKLRSFFFLKMQCFKYCNFLEKEVFQPHLPVRLPCYDFTPVTSSALGAPLFIKKKTQFF